MMKRPFVLLPVLTALTIFGAHATARAEWVQGHAPIMGTAIYVELWHDDKTAGEAAVAAVMDEMRRVDRLMSTYKPESELSRVNAEAAEGPVPVSQELAELVATSLELSELTRGSFDVTYDSVGYLYDFREKKRPTTEQVKDALPGVNYRFVKVDLEQGTIRFLRDGVRINLGGIAKGYAVDRAVTILRNLGVEHAIVTAGGDSRILGDRRGRPWVVGIKDPRRGDEVVAGLPLVDEAISTSGDYERYFEEDGVRYHHIIEPSTGMSARGVYSVTIVGPEATRTDGMSTSVFVLGVEEGLKLINSQPDLEAVIVDDKGRLFYSDGLMQLQES